jgi:hypothetical protein
MSSQSCSNDTADSPEKYQWICDATGDSQVIEKKSRWWLFWQMQDCDEVRASDVVLKSFVLSRLKIHE